MSLNNLIKEAAALTPDPERSLKNFDKLMLQRPEFIEEYFNHIDKIAQLFSYSQFLTDYCIVNPSSLSSFLRESNISIDKQKILEEAYSRYSIFQREITGSYIKEMRMKIIHETSKVSRSSG